MRIVSWTTSNFKRIKVAKVAPDGHVAIVGGKNAQGKSSVLDALMVALAGKSAMPAKPVREGAESAEIVVECDEVVIRRRIKPDGTGDLTITTKDGDKKASPQTWLDARVGKLGFDPLQFVREPAKAQADTLRKLVGVDTSSLDEEYARIFDERTALGREGKAAAGYADGLPRFDDVPSDEVSISDLVRELNDASQAAQNKALADVAVVSAKGRMDHASARVAQLESKAQSAPDELDRALASLADLLAGARQQNEETIARANSERDAALVAAKAAFDRAVKAAHDAHASAMSNAANALSSAVERIEARASVEKANAANDASARDAQLFEAHTALDSATDDLSSAEARASSIVVPDVDAVQRRMASIEATNAKVRANKERAKADAKAASLREQYAAMSKRLDGNRSARAALIQSANYPIEGLGFAEDGTVTYGGIPLSQASQAEQIRVSMAIGLAMNPALRLVLIRDASLLDDTSMGIVSDLAEKNDALVILERVGDGDAGAIVIEDGEVKQ